MRYRKNCSGFTLVELVVVVAILAILMAMAVPQMIGYTKASHRMAGRTEAYLCVDAVQRYLDDEKEKGTLSAGDVYKRQAWLQWISRGDLENAIFLLWSIIWKRKSWMYTQMPWNRPGSFMDPLFWCLTVPRRQPRSCVKRAIVY